MLIRRIRSAHQDQQTPLPIAGHSHGPSDLFLARLRAFARSFVASLCVSFRVHPIFVALLLDTPTRPMSHRIIQPPPPRHFRPAKTKKKRKEAHAQPAQRWDPLPPLSVCMFAPVLCRSFAAPVHRNMAAQRSFPSSSTLHGAPQALSDVRGKHDACFTAGVHPQRLSRQEALTPCRLNLLRRTDIPSYPQGLVRWATRMWWDTHARPRKDELPLGWSCPHRAFLQHLPYPYCWPQPQSKPAASGERCTQQAFSISPHTLHWMGIFNFLCQTAGCRPQGHAKLSHGPNASRQPVLRICLAKTGLEAMRAAAILWLPSMPEPLSANHSGHTTSGP